MEVVWGWTAWAVWVLLPVVYLCLGALSIRFLKWEFDANRRAAEAEVAREQSPEGGEGGVSTKPRARSTAQKCRNGVSKRRGRSRSFVDDGATEGGEPWVHASGNQYALLASGQSTPVGSDSDNEGSASVSDVRVDGDDSGSNGGTPRVLLPVTPKVALKLTRYTGIGDEEQVAVLADARIETPRATGRVSLAWEDKPQTVFVVKKWHNEEISERMCVLVQWLIEVRGMRVIVEPSVYTDVDELPGLREHVQLQTFCPSMCRGADEGDAHTHRCCSQGDLRAWMLQVSAWSQSLSSGSVDMDTSMSRPPRPAGSRVCRCEWSQCTLESAVDFVVCLGGDGTLLHAMHQFARSVPPVVSFALGSMGFLTPFDFDNHTQIISRVIQGDFNLTLRARLVCQITAPVDDASAGGVPFRATDRSHQHLAARAVMQGSSPRLPAPLGRRLVGEYQVLNEIVVDRGPESTLCSLDVYCDNEYITTVQADGMIVATATGSTAYSLSAGGSITHPGVPAILMTPICPHSISFRPIIFPDSSTIRIQTSAGARHTAWVSCDGRARQELKAGMRLQCTISPWPVPTVSKANETRDWLLSLRRNLHWNRRVTQKSFQKRSKKRGRRGS